MPFRTMAMDAGARGEKEIRDMAARIERDEYAKEMRRQYDEMLQEEADAINAQVEKAADDF